MSLNAGPIFLVSTAWQLRQPLDLTTSAPDCANAAPAATAIIPASHVIFMLRSPLVRMVLVRIVSVRTVWSALLESIVIRDAEEIDLLGRVLGEAGAVGISPRLPGPVVGLEPVVDVIQADARVFLQGIAGEKIEPRELVVNVGQRIHRTALDRFQMVLVRDLRVAELRAQVDLPGELAPHAAAEIVAQVAHAGAPDWVGAGGGADARSGSGFAGGLVEARVVARIPGVGLPAIVEHIAGIERPVRGLARARPEVRSVPPAVVVARLVGVELEVERSGRRPADGPPARVAGAVGEEPGRDEVAAAGPAVLHCRLERRAVGMAVHQGDRADQRLSHRTPQLHPPGGLIGRLASAHDADRGNVAFLLL